MRTEARYYSEHSINLSILIATLGGRCYCYPSFIEEKSEAQRSELIGQGSHVPCN